MNTPIRRIGLVVAMMFMALLVASTMIQFVQAGELNAKPGNRRTLLSTYQRDRGSILVDGTAVASTRVTDDQYERQRVYSPGAPYAPLTGYYSFIYQAGRGVERSHDALLSGTSDKLFYRRMSDILSGKQVKGASVELTVDPRVQRAAWDALGDQRGAVVALDPKTGAVLAMVSKPSYDPNLLAGHDLKAVRRSYERLLDDPGKPLVNRAISGDLYPPGSTFKLVTAAAALESGRYDARSELPAPAVLQLPDTRTTLPNVTGQACGPGDRTDLAHAVEISCNTYFGRLGMDLGAKAIAEQAAKFGFGRSVAAPVPSTPSTFPSDMTAAQTAQAAIGQYDVRTTPLQVAMWTAAIANGGTEMTPYVVKTVRDQDLDVISTTEPERFAEPISSETAAALTEMMQSVVTSGSGRLAQIPGVAVAGKTGTAQTGRGLADVWFTGFAPADDPRVVVAVVVEDGGTMRDEASGGVVAAPIARQVMEAVVRR